LIFRTTLDGADWTATGCPADPASPVAMAVFDRWAADMSARVTRYVAEQVSF
jgi:hypothetical protein